MSRTFRKCDPNYGSIFDTNRDKKKWYKPVKKFKKVRRASEKAKVKNALRNSTEIVLVFKKNDVWDWI